MAATSGRTKVILGAIVLLGLGVRIFWGLKQGGDLSRLPDQREYFDLGTHLKNHQGLWFSDARFGEIVYAFRTPGYPMLIAVCGGSLRAVRLFQALLDTSTIVAVFLLARRWLPPASSLVAAGLVAFNPYLIYFTGLILTETLFTAMLMWGMALLVLSNGPWPPRWGRKVLWLLGCVLLAMSVMVRPGAMLLPVILAVAGALVNRDTAMAYRNRWPLPVATTVLVLMLLVLIPWAARNRTRLGSWVWATTNEGITRFDGFNPDATGASDQAFTRKMPWLQSMSEVGRSEYLDDRADEFIRENPGRAAQLAVIKSGRTWSPVPLSREFGGRRLYVAVGLFYGVVLDLLIVAGLWTTGLATPVKRYLLLPALYFTIAAALSVGSLRYRIPAEPPMAILAAGAISRLGAIYDVRISRRQ